MKKLIFYFLIFFCFSLQGQLNYFSEISGKVDGLHSCIKTENGYLYNVRFAQGSILESPEILFMSHDGEVRKIERTTNDSTLVPDNTFTKNRDLNLLVGVEHKYINGLYNGKFLVKSIDEDLITKDSFLLNIMPQKRYFASYYAFRQSNTMYVNLGPYVKQTDKDSLVLLFQAFEFINENPFSLTLFGPRNYLIKSTFSNPSSSFIKQIGEDEIPFSSVLTNKYIYLTYTDFIKQYDYNGVLKRNFNFDIGNLSGDILGSGINWLGNRLYTASMTARNLGTGCVGESIVIHQRDEDFNIIRSKKLDTCNLFPSGSRPFVLSKSGHIYYAAIKPDINQKSESILLYKFDTLLNQIWMKEFFAFGPFEDGAAFDLLLTEEDGVLVNIFKFGGNLDIIKVNPNGLISFIKEIRNPYLPTFESFPNPTQDIVTFKMNENIPDISTAEIIDISGKLINALQVTSNQVSLASLPSGAYFVALKNSSGKLIGISKVVKM
jgi:hypothetical protein